MTGPDLRRILAVPLWTGGLRQHPVRTLLAVLSIAAGVALGLAVQWVNGAAVAEMAGAARHLAGAADLTVRGPGNGFDEDLYPALARQPGVESASPALEVEVRLAGRTGTLRITGLDVFRAAAIQPGLLASDVHPLDALRPDTVFLSASAMAGLGLAPGDTLEVQAGTGTRRLRVAGRLAGERPGLRLGVMDLGAAQDAFDRQGYLTRVDLRLRPGTDREAFQRALALPPGVVAEPVEVAGEGAEAATRAYRVNLQVLALVALFTGGLLVFSTQSLSVARRRAQLALLRVLGATRAQVLALVLAEGAALGLAGALLGVPAGAGLAALALSLSGGDLGAGFLAGLRARLVPDPLAALLFGGLGVLAALAGSVGPATEAARAAPARALKGHADLEAWAPLRSPWPGLVVLAAGTALLALPPIGALPLGGYAAIALLLCGTLLLLPRLVRSLLAAWPEPGAVAAGLALARLRARPLQAALGLSAVVAAVSLTVAMGVMVASFRVSLEQWLETMLPAPLYLRACGQGDSACLSLQDQAVIRALPGVARVEFLRWTTLRTGDGPPVVLLARDGVTGEGLRRLPLVGPARPGPPGVPEAWVSEAAAALHGWAPGQRLDLPLSGRLVRFHVAGVWRDYARQAGAVLVDRTSYVQLAGDPFASDAGLWLTEPARLSAVRAALLALGPGAFEVLEPGDIRTLSLTVFDRTFAVTYALQAVALAIGLLGLTGTIATEVIDRRHEFGALRHLGLARAQIARLLAVEGTALAAAGLVVGTALGLAVSLVLIHVVNRQSFHWGMDLHVPWLPLMAFAAALTALAALSAVLSGRHAMGGDAVRAVREDW